MESLLFFLNSLAVVVMVIMGLRDDRRRPGTTAKSYFRYIEDGEARLDVPETAAKRRLPARKGVGGRRP